MYDINFQFFIDSDTNPFILFDNSGKIIYLNNSAEILFGYVSKAELYDMTLRYAPATFGSKHTILTLNYDSFSFYAIDVGYESEEQIYIRLYNKPRIKQNIKIDKNKFVLTDINILLEANITLFKIKNSNSLKLLTDPDIPKFKIEQNNFSKLLRKTLNSFTTSSYIDITLKLLIGEHIIINEKRYSIVQLSILSDRRDEIKDSEISTLAKESFITSIFKNNSIILEIPLLID
jgi:hypothetical protein